MFKVGDAVTVLDDPELETDMEWSGVIVGLLEQSITPGWSTWHVQFADGGIQPICECWFKPPAPPSRPESE